MKCNLDAAGLQDLYLLFFNINQIKNDIEIARTATAEYTELINKLHCLDVANAEEGMALCEEALKKISLIQIGEGHTNI